MTNVQKIHETKSPHDVIHKGKVFTFHLSAKPGHTDVLYTTEVEVEIPFIGHKMKDTRPVFNRCITIKWWEKLIGRTEEKKVIAAINEFKNLMKQVAASDEREERLLKKLAQIDAGKM